MSDNSNTTNTPKAQMTIEELNSLVVGVLDDSKAKNIVSIDVDGQTSVADQFIIASATSNRHMASIAEKVVEACKQNGVQPLGIEGEKGAEWVLVDLFDIIIHLMLPTAREYYDLESLWSHKPSTRDNVEQD